MSKYVLLSILLITLNASAQKLAPVKIQSSANLPWDEQEQYVNGFARVLQNSKFSFINKAGKLIAPVEFEGARNFINHLAAVSKNNKWGFINEAGKIVVPLKYDIAFDFNETVTAVFSNKRWWLINTAAQITKALDITVFYGFKNGIAKIEKNGRPGTMNTNGEIIFGKEQPNSLKNNPIPYHPNSSQSANTITVCPENIDFEYGSFLNWQCYTGHVDSIGNTNVITLNPSPPTPNRHTLFSRTIPSAIDPYGLFPVNPPDGSNFALRLGNTLIGAEAEGMRYVIRVPSNDSNFSIKYDYAVVFQNPNHTLWAQPRFQVKVFDSAANAYVTCASFEYVSTSNLPGFAVSTVDTSVIYKPWSTVFLSLRGYAGKTMYLDFKNADCVRRGHWGYSYVDVEKPCGQAIEMQYDCAPPHITHLTGPPGFQTYNWWDSAFTTILATGQQATLNPGPVVNTTIWLQMIPFNNFGCLDTIPVKITGEFTADFGMSDTLGLCAPHTFTFYNHNLPATSATWDFGDGTTGTGDTVAHTYALPGSYLVKLHVVMAGGCIGNTIKVVSVIQPAGSFSFTGGSYCNSYTAQFNAVVSNADSLFWNFGDGTIVHTTQTSISHTYSTAGIFIPTLIIKSLGGCETPVPATDTIKIDIVKAGFTSTDIKVCGSTTLHFTDTSSAYFGITTRQWDFGDGTTGSGINVSHTYTTTGTYTIKLAVTGASGCTDNASQSIYVKVNDIPVVSIAGNTTACQSVPVTFTSVVQSVDAINYYHWTCSNGLSGSGTSFTVNFSQGGNFTIQLIIGTVNGCFDTATHTININPTPDLVQPPSQVLCNGGFASATNFTGAVAGTVYTWTNTAPLIGLAAIGTGNIASFKASSNGSFVASATINVTPTANGCPGAPKSFSITVYPTPNVAQPLDQTLCDNSNTAVIIFSGTVAGTIYDWTNNNASIGLPASGTGNIPSFTASSNGVATNTATITVTPMINGCPGAPKSFSITVHPMPDVVQPVDQALCSGNFTTAINFSGPVTGTLYSWTNNNSTIGLASSGTGNIASFAASSNGTVTNTATITVTPSINGCTATPKTFTITVSPTPDVAQPADQTLCNNSNTAAINFSGAVTGTTYTWTNNNATIGLASSGTGNIPSFTASSNGATINTATITVTPMFNGCPGTPKIFTITVNPMPDVVQPADQQLCNRNFTAPINFTGPVAGTVYTWTNTTPSIGLASSGTGNIPSFQAYSNGSFEANATITVKATANGCGVSSKTFRITVNPMPDVSQTGNQTVCNGAIINPVTFTGSVAGTVYNWTNNNSAIGLPVSGTGDIASFTAVNNTANPITATITVLPTSSNCTGTSKTFVININPTPNVVATNNAVVCLGNTAQLNAAGATQYTWTPVDHLTCSTCANPVAKPTDSIIYKVKGTSSFGCYAYDSVILSVIKPFKMKVSPDDTLCIGATAGMAAFNAGSYIWSPPTNLSGAYTSNPLAKPSVTTRYQVIGFDGHNCFTDTGYVLITVGPKPTVSLGPDRTLATGTPLTLSTIITNGPIVKWAWTPAQELSCSDCPLPTTIVKNNSFYIVQVTNNFGCIASDTLIINSICKSAQVYIPNAFTPDGDGLNDILMIRGRGITIKSFRIFNRWGELVFEKENFSPNDPKYGWDGKVRGVPATPDVFVYTAEIFCDNGIPYTYKGNVTILK